MKLAVKPPRGWQAERSEAMTPPTVKEFRFMKRKQKNTRRIIKILLVWLPFVIYISLISPSSMISFLGFYALLSFALFSTFKVYFEMSRTIMWMTVILLYLALKQFHLDNILNTIILLGIFITLEIYFRKF